MKTTTEDMTAGGAVDSAMGGASDQPWRILELFARNSSVKEILAEAVLMLGQRYSAERAVILVQCKGRLRRGASSGLSDRFLIEVGRLPSAGGLVFSDRPADCGKMAFGSDSGPEEWRRAVADEGLWGCRAEPILSAAGEVLGEVVAFLDAPAPEDTVFAEGLRMAARIAGLALEHAHMAEDLLYHAHHDSTTLLPNRYLFNERAAQAIADAARNGGQVAILHANLDRFRTVNDLLGRGVGDLVLEQVARRMEASFVPGTVLARIASDEFCALLTGIEGPDDAIRAAERLRARLAMPLAVGGHELTMTASIGCALHPAHAPDANTLERCAESAVQRAKHGGRNCVRGFVPGDAASALQRARMETALSHAVKRREFEMVYQPQVSLRTLEVSGAEALLRWRHPTIGLVSPGAFIPIAEETGLILPIGEWVLEQVCGQTAAWRGLGFKGRVAVNVSALQLAQDDFLALVRSAMEDAGTPPDSIEIELTESVLVGDPNRAAEKMRELKSLGVSLAADDFGTGYSSLSSLQQFPVDLIKIDIAFIRQIETEDSSSPVIESILGIARSLGKAVLAEGVETLGQQAYLAAIGCDFAQGYLYGRPTAASDFTAKWVSPMR